MSEKKVWKTSEDKRINDAVNELLNAIGEFARRKAIEDNLELKDCIMVQHETLLSVIECLVKRYRDKLERGIRAVMEKVEKETEAKTEDADSHAG